MAVEAVPALADVVARDPDRDRPGLGPHRRPRAGGGVETSPSVPALLIVALWGLFRQFTDDCRRGLPILQQPLADPSPTPDRDFGVTTVVSTASLLGSARRSQA